jgi:hypothetical protein
MRRQRATVRRLRRFLLVISVLTLVGGAQFYGVYLRQSAAASHAQRVLRDARKSLVRAGSRKQRLVSSLRAATDHVGHAELTADEEAVGIAGPGLSGVPGVGPNAQRDRFVATELERRGSMAVRVRE